MSGNPEFSVVIPAYNAERVIGTAIRSVLNQTWEDFELVVVDDGSSDTTPDLVESMTDSRVRLIRQENQGTAGARNTGIANSSGTYVSFLDNDDLWMPDFLEKMRLALAHEASAAFAYTDAWVLVDGLHRIRKTTAMSGSRPPEPPPSDPSDFLTELMRRNFILCSASIRRSAIKRVGGFRPGLGGCDDYDLWIRLIGAGHRAIRVPGLLTIWRDRADSQSKDSVAMLRGLERVISSAIQEQPLPASAETAAREQLTEVHRALRRMAGSGGTAALAYRARMRLSALTRPVRARLGTYAEPPPQVAEVFPDLRQL
jgi:glycosyltransferase involved in cell wall biosynthesis